MQVPDGWEVKKLGEIAKFKGGDGFSEDYQGLENGDYPFLKVSDMNLVGNELYITKANNYVDSILQKEFKYTLFPKETIIFAKVGAALLLNRRRVLTKDSIIDNNMMGSIVKNNFSFEYLYYILCSIDFANYVQTGALPSINQETIANIIIKTPKEKKEQEKIAKILSTLDKNIESTNRLIEKEKNIKKALMQELLTNGIDKDGHIRTRTTHTYKPSELGLIPDEWEVVSLKDVMTIQYGKDQKEVEVENGKYPILGSGGVIGYTNHCLYDKPSVLIGRKGTIDNPQYMETPFWTVDTLFYSHIKSNSFPKWVFYTFQTINWRAYNEASGVPSLSTSNINSVKIKKPPKEEQKQIAKILITQDKKIQTEETNLVKLKELKKGLMNDLLSGKVRVVSD